MTEGQLQSAILESYYLGGISINTINLFIEIIDNQSSMLRNYNASKHEIYKEFALNECINRWTAFNPDKGKSLSYFNIIARASLRKNLYHNSKKNKK